MLRRFFFSSFLGAVLGQERSFFHALFDFGFQNDASATASKDGNKDKDRGEPKKRLRNDQGAQEARIPQPALAYANALQYTDGY